MLTKSDKLGASAILNHLVRREKFGPGSLSQRLASEVEDFTAKYSDIPFNISHQIVIIHLYIFPSHIHPASSKNQSKRAIFLSQVALHLLTSKYAKSSAKPEQ